MRLTRYYHNGSSDNLRFSTPCCCGKLNQNKKLSTHKLSQTARINCRKATHKLSQTDIFLYLFPIVILPLLWKTPNSLKLRSSLRSRWFFNPPRRSAPPSRPQPSAATRSSEPLDKRKRQTKRYSRNQTSSPPTSSAYILASLGMYLAASRRLRGREKRSVIARCDLQ